MSQIPVEGKEVVSCVLVRGIDNDQYALKQGIRFNMGGRRLIVIGDAAIATAALRPWRLRLAEVEHYDVGTPPPQGVNVVTFDANVPVKN